MCFSGVIRVRISLVRQTDWLESSALLVPWSSTCLCIHLLCKSVNVSQRQCRGSSFWFEREQAQCPVAAFVRTACRIVALLVFTSTTKAKLC